MRARGQGHLFGRGAFGGQVVKTILQRSSNFFLLLFTFNGIAFLISSPFVAYKANNYFYNITELSEVDNSIYLRYFADIVEPLTIYLQISSIFVAVFIVFNIVFDVRKISALTVISAIYFGIFPLWLIFFRSPVSATIPDNDNYGIIYLIVNVAICAGLVIVGQFRIRTIRVSTCEAASPPPLRAAPRW